MTLEQSRFETLLQALATIDPSKIAQWDEEDAQFTRDVEAFVATLFADGAETDDHRNLASLQRRMLALLLLSTEPHDVTSPAEVGEQLCVRNRKLIRAAGRLLAQRGVVMAQTEPSDTAEGEFVHGYSVIESIQTALDAYIGEQHKSRQVAAPETAQQ